MKSVSAPEYGAPEAAEQALAGLSTDAAKQLIASYLVSHKEVDVDELLKDVSEGSLKNLKIDPVPPRVGQAKSSSSYDRHMSSPLPVANDHCRLGDQLYEIDIVRDPHSVNANLLTKPEPCFHGERSEKARDAAQIHHFPLRVVFDGLTSGLEASSRFKCHVGQVLGGRYKVLQYIGSGTFGHTVHCEDMECKDDMHRWVCVKISKTSKDVFDQNLWEVKVLKLLHERIGGDEEAAERLPALLDVFYFRETLFVVYELLRDNLYHIYKYLGEQKMPTYFTPARCREVARQVLLTVKELHAHGVIHADLKPENILIDSLSACLVKVIDFGNAYLVGDERCSYIQSRSYRAPEVILGVDYSPKVDLWSLGCILMELATGHLLFDNRSVQQLLASHIALRGPMPAALLRGGKLAKHYFAGSPVSPEKSPARGMSNRWAAPLQEKVRLYKMGDDGTVSRLTPLRDASIAKVLERHGIVDPQFASFINDLLTMDPELRPSAVSALEHPWLTQASPDDLEPYAVDATFDMAGRDASLRKNSNEHVKSPLSPPELEESSSQKLTLRYPSLREEPHAEKDDALRRGSQAPSSVRNSAASMRASESGPGAPTSPPVSHADIRSSAKLASGRHSCGSGRHSCGSAIEEELPGPLTPADFREKSYFDREKQMAAPARNGPESRDKPQAAATATTAAATAAAARQPSAQNGKKPRKHSIPGMLLPSRKASAGGPRSSSTSVSES